MKYKYNIAHSKNKSKNVINFKSKDKLIAYLNKNKAKVNNLDDVYINFNQVKLPLKATVWSVQKMIDVIKNSEAQTFKYVLINTSLRPSYALIKRCRLTKYEAQQKNYAFGLNQATKKYILEVDWS